MTLNVRDDDQTDARPHSPQPPGLAGGPQLLVRQSGQSLRFDHPALAQRTTRPNIRSRRRHPKNRSTCDLRHNEIALPARKGPPANKQTKAIEPGRVLVVDRVGVAVLLAHRRDRQPHRTESLLLYSNNSALHWGTNPYRCGSIKHDQGQKHKGSWRVRANGREIKLKTDHKTKELRKSINIIEAEDESQTWRGALRI